VREEEERVLVFFFIYFLSDEHCLLFSHFLYESIVLRRQPSGQCFALSIATKVVNSIFKPGDQCIVHLRFTYV
jgi:hypothetical protein